jgi:hypothetical protein
MNQSSSWMHRIAPIWVPSCSPNALGWNAKETLGKTTKTWSWDQCGVTKFWMTITKPICVVCWPELSFQTASTCISGHAKVFKIELRHQVGWVLDDRQDLGLKGLAREPPWPEPETQINKIVIMNFSEIAQPEYFIIENMQWWHGAFIC